MGEKTFRYVDPFHEWLARASRGDGARFDLELVTVDFVPFATGAGANVMSQANFLVNGQLSAGYSVGVADETFTGKVERQASFIASAIATLVATVTNENVADDGNLNGKIQQIWQTLLQTGYFVDQGSASALLTADPTVPTAAGGALSFPAPQAGTTITIKTAFACTGATTLNWMGNGNVSVTYPDGTALGAGDYGAGQLLTLEFDGTAWRLTSLPVGFFRNNTRTVLTGAATLYVNASTGSDSTGNGTSGAPWQTLQHARNVVLAGYDTRGNTVTFNCTGAFTAGLNAQAAFVGAVNAGSEIWNFTAGSSVAATNGSAISAGFGVNLTVQASGSGVTLSATGTGGGQGYGIVATGGSTSINVGAGITYGACAVAGRSAQGGGIVNVTASFTVAGGGDYSEYSHQGRIQYTAVLTVTYSGTPTFSIATVGADECGIVECNSANVTQSGSANGQRYASSTNAVINTNSGGANYYPGSSAGSAPNGLYV